MATATLGEVDVEVEMMPNGIFAKEKWEPRGMLNHERSEAMVEDRLIRLVPGQRWVPDARSSMMGCTDSECWFRNDFVVLVVPEAQGLLRGW